MASTEAAWLDRKEYPFASHFLAVNQQRLHYIDVGCGEVIVFVHGTPSWSFDFRNVIKILSASYRCVAPDHIGFGLSDKPRQYDYSTQNHAATLETFITQLGLTNITLVVHDFGGPIGLHYALKYPGNIKKLVILNTWLWSSQEDPDFKKFSKILKSPLVPLLYTYLNFSPRFLLPGSFGKKYKLTSHIHQQYIQPFAKTSERMGTLAFARSLLQDQDWFEQLWSQREVLAEKPILLIWGMQDKFVTPLYLYKFQSFFKQAHTVKLPDAGHFPQEEESSTVANEILTFIRTIVKN